jgi:hypothetical protein
MYGYYVNKKTKNLKRSQSHRKCKLCKLNCWDNLSNCHGFFNLVPNPWEFPHSLERVNSGAFLKRKLAIILKSLKNFHVHVRASCLLLQPELFPAPRVGVLLRPAQRLHCLSQCVQHTAPHREPHSHPHPRTVLPRSPPVLVRFFLSLWQTPEKTIYKEERFILVHGFRGFNPWSLGSIAFGPR